MYKGYLVTLLMMSGCIWLPWAATANELLERAPSPCNESTLESIDGAAHHCDPDPSVAPTPPIQAADNTQVVSEAVEIEEAPAETPSKHYLAGSSLPISERCNSRPASIAANEEVLRPTSEDIYMNADEAIAKENFIELRGNVEVSQKQRGLSADHILYDSALDRFETQGHVSYRQAEFEMSGNSGFLDVEGETGTFEDVEYYLPLRGGRGKAKNIEFLGQGRSRLNDLNYSTCRKHPEDWRMDAKRLELDQSTGIGDARHVSIQFQGVPFLYLPRISFPIDGRRKSGFLVPHVKQSDQVGLDINIPYYLDLAPNYDLTLMPRILSSRGIQLGAEFRYLAENNNEGSATIEYLPNDSKFDDSRGSFAYEHTGKFGTHWRSDISLNRVSDDQYYEDLGSNLSLASITSLERRIDVLYQRPNWSLLSRLQNFQILSGAEAYQRLPQLFYKLESPIGPKRWSYSVDSEFVHFEHKDDRVVVGERLDIKPSISANYGNSYYFFTPKFSLRHTAYQLNDQPAGSPSRLDRTTPITSLDSGLFFERNVEIQSQSLIQTLEPRLYYLYVPERDQDELPVFDTSSLDFSVAQLYRDNRFSGADRQGDANQLTLSVTSRLLSTINAKEYLRGSLGQILYFSESTVNLPNEPVRTNEHSDLVAELGANLWNYSSVSAGILWDPEQQRTEKSVFRYKYQPDDSRIFNISYRFRKDEVEQTDLSAIWPLNQKWSGIARWNYSLLDKVTLESFAGFEYDSCCWAMRLVGRRYITNELGEKVNSVQLELILKGLTSVGHKVENLLEQGILGYGQSDNIQ